MILDTHVWLWMMTAPERLGKLLPQVNDASNELLLSAASSWEIAIKQARGRLSLPEPAMDYVPSMIRTTAVTPIAVEHVHALAVVQLPHHHRDPFDRLLIAQAQVLDVPLATADPELLAYDVDLITP